MEKLEKLEEALTEQSSVAPSRKAASETETRTENVGTAGFLVGIIAGTVAANIYIRNSNVIETFQRSGVQSMDGQIYIGSAFAFGLAFAVLFSSVYDWYATRQANINKPKGR